MPVEAGRDTARHIAGAKLMVIDGMGHDLAPGLLPILVEAIAAHCRDTEVRHRDLSAARHERLTCAAPTDVNWRWRRDTGRIPMDEQLRIAALEYHRLPTPGKISVTPTKGLINQRDLALAYSPGVAAACDAIAADPDEARHADLARPISSPSSPTAPPCSGSATSGRWPASR